jgi:branched-chain amino acid transport system ATP-binding protein
MSGATSGALLRVEHVTKRFGGLVANDDVSFEVQRGQIVGLIGPNGAGKTTLFNSIAGYDTPTSGAVWLDGQ